MRKINPTTVWMVLFVIIGVLAGCSPSPASPTDFAPLPATQTVTPAPVVTPTPVQNADLSRRGWFIYLCLTENEMNYDLCLVSPDRKKVIKMGVSGLGEWTTSPAWSPDGQTVVFEVDESVNASFYRVDVNCVNTTAGCLASAQKISPDQTGAFMHPSWSPDGKKIAYAFQARVGENSHIWVMDSDGRNATRLTDIEGFNPAWSPNGNQIAFTSFYQWEGGSDVRGNVFVMNADGSNIHKLTEALPNSYSPDWSPDGEYLVFVSTEGKNPFDQDFSPAIYKARADGSELVRLGFGEAPAWSPDGKYIAFIKGVDELWLMDIESRQTEKIDNINPLGGIFWRPDVFTLQP